MHLSYLVLTQNLKDYQVWQMFANISCRITCLLVAYGNTYDCNFVTCRVAWVWRWNNQNEEGLWDKDVVENIWTDVGGCNRRVENITS
jgi:hypothetical protein